MEERKIVAILKACHTPEMLKVVSIQWTYDMHNEDILKKGRPRKRIDYLYQKKTIKILLAHHEEGKLEYVVTMGKLEKTRDTGRRREVMLDSLVWRKI